jgi:hypothetical protein
MGLVEHFVRRASTAQDINNWKLLCFLKSVKEETERKGKGWEKYLSARSRNHFLGGGAKC